MAIKDETCIGVLGGGQLGRMLALEARRMGFQVLQWSGGDNSGAARIADDVINESFSDKAALEKFIAATDVATVEFENIPTVLLQAIETRMPLMPGSKSVAVCQHRHREKTFLQNQNVPTAAFRLVDGAQALYQACNDLDGDAILKTAEAGYDGKGQRVVASDAPRDLQALTEIWNAMGEVACILEKKVRIAKEISVIVVRGQDGKTTTYDPAENIHENHILACSIVPARVSESMTQEAQATAKRIAEALDYVGVLGVEFFIDENETLLVNELAPRPHNSGHHTLDACLTSQFEQQLRAVCGLPLGSTQLIQPAVMWNLLGERWADANTPPDWTPILETPGAALHVYGKHPAKVGRKMGHVTFISDDIDTAIERKQRCEAQLPATLT